MDKAPKKLFFAHKMFPSKSNTVYPIFMPREILFLTSIFILQPTSVVYKQCISMVQVRWNIFRLTQKGAIFREKSIFFKTTLRIKMQFAQL